MKKNILLLILVACVTLGAPAMAGEPVVSTTPTPAPAYQWDKFAIGISYAYQQQDYELTDVSFTLPPMAPPLGLGPESVREIENTADSFLLKFSYTPYPFVTFFALVGHVDGEVDVAIAPPVGGVSVDYDGIFYGGGATLNYAYEHYFVSVTGTYTVANVDDANIDTLVVSPKIGIFNDRGAIWVGAHYQSTEHSQSGSIALPPLGQVTFDVDLEDEENWSWLVGGRINLSEDLSLTLEAGFGDRKQAIVSLERKF